MTGSTANGVDPGALAGGLRRFWPTSIRSRLIVSVALAHCLLVAIFVADLVERQRTFLASQSLEYARSAASILAVNSSSWVLANDVVGLGELVKQIEGGAPNIRYAMVVSPAGLVLAHTDGSRVGQYLRDDRSLAMLSGAPRPTTVFAGSRLIDVVAPVPSSTGTYLGWARVGLGQETVVRNLARLSRDGAAYAVLAGALGALLAGFFAFRLTSGLGKLVELSGQVRDAESTLRADTSGRDEVALLGRGINRMLDSIRDSDRGRRELEASLIESQKLESVGRLAGGVAHDFNNLLTVINGNAQILIDSLPPGDPARADAGEILAAGQRASDVARNLLAFSRKSLAAAVPLDVNGVVKRFERLLTRIIGEDVAITIRTAPEPLVVVGDRGQLEQVLMNLATNARDALPHGGTIVVDTAAAQVTAAPAQAHGGAGAGRYAVITVHDDGKGMDEETCRRIFEPFFSTKEVGKGTGLGMAIVYGIVRQHGGFIQVESQPGEGSTFRVYLPISDADLPDVPGPGPVKPPGANRGGTETILLAEDDPALRTLAERVLKTAGYRVVVARDGEEAVARFAERPGDFHLCVFDIVMPRKSGYAAFAEVAAIRPGTRVIFTSGWSPETSPQAASPAGSEFIQKPYAPTDLLERVRAVLDR